MHDDGTTIGLVRGEHRTPGTDTVVRCTCGSATTVIRVGEPTVNEDGEPTDRLPLPLELELHAQRPVGPDVDHAGHDPVVADVHHGDRLREVDGVLGEGEVEHVDVRAAALDHRPRPSLAITLGIGREVLSVRDVEAGAVSGDEDLVARRSGREP